MVDAKLGTGKRPEISFTFSDTVTEELREMEHERGWQYSWNPKNLNILECPVLSKWEHQYYIDALIK